MTARTGDGGGRAAAGPLSFRPVTGETLDDLARFAEAHGRFRWCACMRLRLTSTAFRDSDAPGRLAALEDRARRGVPIGVLAYDGAVPVGWCSVAPRATFDGLARSRTLPPVDEVPVWSVTCFFVDARYRRHGLTEGLLRAAVDYARAAGAEAVEGYPVEPGPRSYTYMGAPSVFARVGFRDVTPPGRARRVMRIRLNESCATPEG